MFGLLLGAGACKKEKAQDVEELAAQLRAEEKALGFSEPVNIEVVGFNYTDLPIDGFSARGVGGANIFVSSPTSGGSSPICCMSWYPGVELPIPVKVRWTRGNRRWCVKEVMVSGPSPKNPQYLGVHFFPDGHIEAGLSEEYPEVRLRLERFDYLRRKESGNTVLDEKVARCENDKYQ